MIYHHMVLVCRILQQKVWYVLIKSVVRLRLSGLHVADSTYVDMTYPTDFGLYASLYTRTKCQPNTKDVVLRTRHIKEFAQQYSYTQDS